MAAALLRDDIAIFVYPGLQSAILPYFYVPI
jgi:hypothetical protein